MVFVLDGASEGFTRVLAYWPQPSDRSRLSFFLLSYFCEALFAGFCVRPILHLFGFSLLLVGWGMCQDRNGRVYLNGLAKNMCSLASVLFVRKQKHWTPAQVDAFVQQVRMGCEWGDENASIVLFSRRAFAELSMSGCLW